MAIFAIGDSEPEIDASAYVHPQATVIGNVRLGPSSSVWPQAVLRGDYGSITIGEGSNVQDGAVLHATYELHTVVGDYVVIGHLAPKGAPSVTMRSSGSGPSSSTASS